MDNGKILCYGEMLMRISPSLNKRWLHSSPILAFVGGAELNVATALACWEVPVKYFTALPDNYLSLEIQKEINELHIDAAAMQFSGKRFGIYYLPQGADLKNAGVIYDRDDTSFSTLKPGTVNWDEVLQGCSWLHFSAICPALSQDAADVCLELVEAAAAKNIYISIDLNYRSKLWKYGKDPVEIMPKITQHASLIMGNLWAVEGLLGIPSPIASSKGKTKEELLAAAAKNIGDIQKEYKKAEVFAFTFRFPDAYFALLHTDTLYVSKHYTLTDVKDQVGSGDCFMGGLIYGFHHKHPHQHIIDFAAAAAIGKLQENDDATSQTISEVEKIMSN